MSMDISVLKMRMARHLAHIWRFKSLGLANWAIRPDLQPSLVSFPFFGLNLWVDLARAGQGILFVKGERFFEERFLVKSLLKPGMSVVDVGANIGCYTLLFASIVGERGRILSFEPEPRNMQELRRNVEFNELHNVDLYEMAVGDQNGIVQFCRGINGRVSRGTELETVDVPSVTLDSIITQPVDLLKIDVEGYEAHVLKGAETIIREHRPILFVEIHPCFLTEDYGVKDILDFVRTFYTSVSFYGVDERRFLDKVRVRYLRHDPVVEIETPNEAFLSGQVRNTFWIVCRDQ